MKGPRLKKKLCMQIVYEDDFSFSFLSLTGKNGESLEALQPLHFHHFAWPSSDTILTVTYSSDNKNSTVMYFSVPMDGSEEKQMSLR